MKVIRIKFSLTIVLIIGIITGTVCGFLINAAKDAFVLDMQNPDVISKSHKLAVIMYHSISDNLSQCGAYVVHTQQFENDIKYLVDNSYTFISTEDLKNYVFANTPLPDRLIMITMDDGFYNNYLYAYPILKKYNAKAVISPIAKVCSDYTVNPDTHPFYANLSWEHVKEMSQSGLVFFENHTYNMHSFKGRNGCSKMRGELTEEYQAKLYNDLSQADELIYDATGRKPIAMVYPFGSVSKEARDVITRLGYVMSFSCSEGINTISKDPECLFMLKRFNRASGKTSEQFFSKKLY